MDCCGPGHEESTTCAFVMAGWGRTGSTAAGPVRLRGKSYLCQRPTLRPRVKSGSLHAPRVPSNRGRRPLSVACRPESDEKKAICGARKLTVAATARYRPTIGSIIRGMISMRDADDFVGTAPSVESALKRLHGLVQAGDGRVLRSIDRCRYQAHHPISGRRFFLLH